MIERIVAFGPEFASIVLVTASVRRYDALRFRPQPLATAFVVLGPRPFRPGLVTSRFSSVVDRPAVSPKRLLVSTSR